MKQMTILLNTECSLETLFEICQLGQPYPAPMRLHVRSIVPENCGNEAIVTLTGTQEDLEEMFEQYVKEMNSTIEFERPNYPITDVPSSNHTCGTEASAKPCAVEGCDAPITDVS